MSLLANELDVQCALHRQVGLAVVFQNFVLHEATNGCRFFTDSLKAYFENVNIG